MLTTGANQGAAARGARSRSFDPRASSLLPALFSANAMINRHRAAPAWRRGGSWLAGIICLGLLPLAGCQPTGENASAPPVAEVTVAKPLVQTATDYEEFIGRTKAAEYVEIRSRVTGYLVKILFEDGDEVEKAQELFEIDPRPFRADYNKALADVKVAEADVKFRTADVERNKPLVATKAVTQADFDKMVALQDEAAATLESRRALANTAALNLSFTKIVSPIAGRASRAKVTYGNLVQADSTLLTTVVSVDPMFVYFSPDEATHLRVQAAARDGRLKLDKGKVDVWMELANETGFPHRGVIDFSENQVDAATGTIEIRGVFDNPKPAMGNRELQPGLFCRVRVPWATLPSGDGQRTGDRLRSGAEIRPGRRCRSQGRAAPRGTGPLGRWHAGDRGRACRPMSR